MYVLFPHVFSCLNRARFTSSLMYCVFHLLTERTNRHILTIHTTNFVRLMVAKPTLTYKVRNDESKERKPYNRNQEYSFTSNFFKYCHCLQSFIININLFGVINQTAKVILFIEIQKLLQYFFLKSSLHTVLAFKLFTSCSLIIEQHQPPILVHYDCLSKKYLC